MVALVQRVSRLEKKVALRSGTDPVERQPVYQPSEADLADAVAILVECGALREVRS